MKGLARAGLRSVTLRYLVASADKKRDMKALAWRRFNMITILGLLLLGTGCASTCEFENTLLFMERQKFDEICMVMNEPAELAGQEYCLRKKVEPSVNPLVMQAE